ncbi:MAG TPA: CBS domain-containing protein, partial [Ktedonobacterales bacterium]|nr:CBS domain-containing protein [Ktedonobacterales bacterium]
FVREVARSRFVALGADIPVDELERRIQDESRPRGQYLFPVVDEQGLLLGVVARSDVQRIAHDPFAALGELRLRDIMMKDPVVAYPDEPLRAVVYRMASTGLTRFPVVDRENPRKLVGMVSFTDLLKGRALNLEAEQRRERVLPLHIVFPRRRVRQRPASPAPPTPVSPTTAPTPTALPEAPPDASTESETLPEPESPAESETPQS